MSGLIPYSFWGGVNETTFSTGLKGARFVGYFADDVYWFNSATPHGDVQNNVTSIDSFSSNADLYSWQWFGYFLAPVTGTYTFYTKSDDASYLWIGNNALGNNYTVGNALVNNGGLHAEVEQSGTVTLQANTYYALRIQFGENGGGDIMTVSFQGPGITKTTNGTGYYFGGQESYSGAWIGGVVPRYDGEEEIGSGGMPSSGLVLHLDAGNTASYPGTGTTWYNLANANFTTTLVPWNSGNPIAYSSANGGSLLFAGAGPFERDRADVTTTLANRQTWNSYWSSSTAMTCVVIMKAKFTGGITIRDSIIGQRYFFGVGFGYHIHCNFNQTRAAPATTMPYSTSANNFTFLGDGFNTPPTDGPAWENFDNQVIFTGFTHNGSTRNITYWLNNSFYSSTSPQFTPANTYMTDETNNVQIGVFADAGGWRDKSIFQIAIWNRELTTAEITGIYNTFKSRHGYA